MSRYTLFVAMLFASACAVPAETAGAPVQAQLSDTESLMPESPPEPEREKPQPEEPAYRKTEAGITGLPGASGLTFTQLDDYLAHLEKGGHVDRPFWEKLKDGRYRWNTGRGMQFQQPKYATRDELLARYGFVE